MSSLPGPSNPTPVDVFNSAEEVGNTNMCFKTASGKNFKISAAAIRKAQSLMMSVEKEDIPFLPKDVEFLPMNKSEETKEGKLALKTGTDDDITNDCEPAIAEPNPNKSDKTDDIPTKRFKLLYPAAASSRNVVSQVVSAVTPVKKRLGSSRIRSSLGSQNPSFREFKPPTRISVLNQAKNTPASSASGSKDLNNKDSTLASEIDDAVAACLNDGHANF